MDKTYKIGIVDDEALFRRGLDMLINNNPRLKTHLIAENGQVLIEKLKLCEEFPDLVLCDLEMPIKDGVEVTKELSAVYPGIKIVVLSSHYEPSLILKMMEIGASAFMPKNEKPDEFYATIINVMERGFHYNDYIVQLIREKMLFGTKVKKLNHVSLTKREKEVLGLICEQKTNKEIGEEIFISPRTVEGHRNKLLEKTRSKNTAGLIIFAIEQGLFTVNIKNKWR